MSRVLILGVGGQDGSYLAEYLVERGGCEVHGTLRRSSLDNQRRLKDVIGRITIHSADLTDGGSVERVLRDVRPTHVYNLADQDHVGESFRTPQQSVDVTAGAVGRLLESVRSINSSIRVFQPSSSTIFGSGHVTNVDLDSPLRPESPYACAKAHALHLARMYRKKYGMFVSTAILFNHCSPRQKPEYLLHSLAKQIVNVRRGECLGVTILNPLFRIAVGCAREFVSLMALSLEGDRPVDAMICANPPMTLRFLVETVAPDVKVEETSVRTIGGNDGEVSYGCNRGLLKNPVRTALDVLKDLVDHYSREAE